MFCWVSVQTPLKSKIQISCPGNALIYIYVKSAQYTCNDQQWVNHPPTGVDSRNALAVCKKDSPLSLHTVPLETPEPAACNQRV